MTLDEQYQKTIDDQRTFLLKLQDDFNKACDNAKNVAQEKIKSLPKDDKAGREAALQEQKTALDEALHILKTEVDHSTRETMRKLEEVVRKKEELLLGNLEKEMEAL